MAKKIGKSGHATFTGTVLHVTQWELTGANDIQEITSTGSATNTEYIPGYNDYKVSFECFAEFSALQTDLLEPGASGTLKLELADSTLFYTGTAILTNVVVTNAAKTTVMFKCDAQYTGAMTKPVIE